MSQTVNFVWPQGEDLRVALVYKEGESPLKAVAVNLSSGYAAKVSVVLPSTREVLVSIETPSPDITLSSGANKQPNVEFYLPRALALPDGEIYPHLDTTTSFGYDVFLRNTTTNRQVKLLRGTLKIERSNTLWL